MINIAFIIFLTILPVFLIYKEVKINDTSLIYPFVAMLLTISYLLIIYVLNDYAPFASGGDDIGYYRISLKELKSLSDWFNISKFTKSYVQTGYPILLTWLNQFIGDTLYIRKLLNFSFFLFISLYWYKIAFIIKGKKFATLVALFVLFSTPLFYYTLILLKDMSITIIQSYILFNILLINSKKRVLFIYFKLFIAVVLIASFRLPLAIFNVGLIIGASYFSKFENNFKKTGKLFLAVIIFILILIIGFSSSLLNKIGVRGENRNLKNYIEGRNISNHEIKRVSKIKYISLFILKETSGFKKDTWIDLKNPRYIYRSLRGLFAVPWILFFVPMFFLGLYYIWIDKNIQVINYFFKVFIILFMGGYFLIGFISGDTTRWTVSVIPVMALISAYGYINSKLIIKYFSVMGMIFIFLLFSFYKLNL